MFQKILLKYSFKYISIILMYSLSNKLFNKKNYIISPIIIEYINLYSSFYIYNLCIKNNIF